MHSFYCREIPESGTLTQLEEHNAKHLFKTLRGKPGESVELLDGRGTVALAEIMPSRELLVKERSTAPEPAVKLHLFAAPPRRNPLEQMLRQCAEVGVWSITPVIAERSVALPARESAPERWEIILQEGCKQSQNPFLPQVNASISFAAMLEVVKQGRMTAFFGAPGAGQAQIPAGVTDIIWIVGPEGGFSPAEEELLEQAGAQRCRIGRWIMRIETAAICGAAILLNAAD